MTVEQHDGTSDEVLKELTEKWTGPFEAVARRFERTGLDPSRAATTVMAFQNDIVECLSGDDAAVDIIRFMEALATTDRRVDVDEMVRSDGPPLSPREQMFCDFVRPVEDRLPCAVGIAMGEAGITQPEFFESWLRAAGYLDSARRSRGEPRNVILKSMTTDLIDGLYYTLVEALYRIECLRRGQPMTHKRGGEQRKALADWTQAQWPDLLLPYANMFRNGSAHHRRWTYDPARDMVRVTDENPRVPPLELRTRDVYRAFVAIWQDINVLYVLQREVCHPTFVRLMHDCGVFDVLLGRRGQDGFDSAQFERRLEPTRLEWERLTKLPPPGAGRSRRRRRSRG